MFKKFAVAFIVVVGIMVSGWALRADQADAKAPTVTRTVLNQQDLPMPGGFASALVRVQLPVGAREGKHQHPGTLIATVAEGTMTLEVEGKGVLTFKTGETFNVPPGTVHEGMNKSGAPITLIASFVFPKDKPMTIPVK
jgi:quercetin dioxygenase-like cupin family protein